MQTNAEVYTVYFNQALGAVVMEWEGYATSTQFREGTELMLNTLIQHKTSKVLADIENMVLIGKEDQEWLHAHFLPRAMGFGFKSIAIIRPKHYFNNVAVESISYRVDREKLGIHFFDERQAAENWLRAK
jgi:hypothetical protein